MEHLELGALELFELGGALVCELGAGALEQLLAADGVEVVGAQGDDTLAGLECEALAVDFEVGDCAAPREPGLVGGLDRGLDEQAFGVDLAAQRARALIDERPLQADLHDLDDAGEGVVELGALGRVGAVGSLPNSPASALAWPSSGVTTLRSQRQRSLDPCVQSLGVARHEAPASTGSSGNMARRESCTTPS